MVPGHKVTGYETLGILRLMLAYCFGQEGWVPRYLVAGLEVLALVSACW